MHVFEDVWLPGYKLNYVEMMRSYAYWYEAFVHCICFAGTAVCTIFASKVKNLRH